MGRFTRHIVWILVILCSSRWCLGQPDESPSDKYFTLLREKPGNSYLYDRFYQAWLGTKTIEQLETFLRANLEERKDLGSRLLLALFYERQGQDAKALQLYRDVPAGSPVTSEYLFYRARTEARNLDFTAAIADLVQACALPCSGEMVEQVNRLLGELYIRTNQKDKAAALCRQLLEAGDQQQELCVDLIELQIKEGLFDDALQMNEELISRTKDPYKNLMRRLRQGDIYQYKGETDKALDVYAAALESVGEGSWLENQIYAQIERLFDRGGNRDGLKDYLTGLVKRYPKRIGLRKHLANLLLQKGATSEALDTFREILKVTPGDVANQQAYAGMLADAGQLDKAIGLLERLSQDNRQDGELLIHLAELYHQNHQDKQAGTVLDRFLDLSNRQEHACLRVAGLLEQYGLRERAEGVYRQMMAASPGNLGTRQVYAEFLFRTDREEEALRLLQVVAQKGDLQMLLRVCNAVSAREHGDLALQWAEARYREFATDVTYLNHLCKIAIHLKKFDKALAWAQQQLEGTKDFPAIRAALSQVLAAVDSETKARQMISELESKDRLTMQQACLLSELLGAQGQPARADAVMAEAMQHDPEVAARQQVYLYRQRGDWTHVAQALETLLTRSGTREPDLLSEMVEAYEKCGRYDEALKWVRQWQQVSPTSVAPHVRYVQLLETLGRHEEAVAAAEAAGRAFEGDATVLTPLANLYASLGKNEEAQHTYWRLYEAAPTVPEKLNAIRVLAKAAEQAGTQAALIERLQQQRQQSRTSALPLLALAEVYNQMGNYEERRQALLEASRLQTDDLSLLGELADVEATHGDWQEAIRTLQRALALDKTSETRLKIARLHLQHGNTDDGLRILTEVAGGDRMDPRDAESIASTLLSLEAWNTALRFLQGLLPRHAQDYRLKYQYAVALEETGRTKEAMETFLDLLDLQEEIPGNTNKPIPFTWSQQGMATHIERIIPVEAVELLRLEQRYATAYQHRNEWMRYGHPTAPRPVNSSRHVALPPTVGDLRDFALAHILTLAGSPGGPDRSQAAADLTRHGVADAEILLSLSQFGRLNLRLAIEELARTYPDNKTVQAVWILYRLEGQGCTLPEAQHIFDLFAPTHPRLALNVGLRCFGRDPIATRLFTQSLRMLKDVSEPGSYEIASIIYALGNSPSRASLTEAQRALLDRHLIDWYAKLSPTDPSRTQVFRYVALSLGQRKDLSDYIRFLDREVGSGTSSAGTAAAPLNLPVVWHLSYPPRSIPGFPDHVRQLVLDGLNYGLPPSSRLPRMEPAQLGSYLDQIQDPVLKILVAMTSGRTPDAQRLIKAFLEASPTSLAAYLLAASQATIDGAPQQAIVLLEKARSLPAATPYRQMLDGALVANAMELDPPEHPEQMELGQRALLRLIGDRLNPALRGEELLAAAEALGLTKEAQNIRNQISAAATGRPALVPDSRASDIHPFTIALMEQFFARHQPETALRLALNHLKNQAYDSLYCQWADSTPSAVQDMVRLIRQHGATTQFLALAAGPGKAIPRKLVEYGRICELLEQRQEAVAAYEKALASDPKNTAAWTRLALLSAATDAPSAAKHLATIDPGTMNAVGQGLVAMAQQLLSRGQVESALSLARMVTEYLALAKDAEKQNLDWVDGLADAIAAPSRSGSRPLLALYENPSPSTPTLRRSRGLPSFGGAFMVTPGGSVPLPGQIRRNLGLPLQEDGALAAERRRVHDALCRKMLQAPPLAEMGFVRLAAEAKTHGALTSPYLEMAHQAMLTHKPSPQTPSLPTTSSSLWHVGFLYPAEYLVQEAHRIGTLDKLLKEFVPQLKQHGADRQAAKLTALADLYTAKADQFFNAVELLLWGPTAQRPARGPGGAEENRLASLVIEAYLARNATRQLPLEQFLLDKIKEDIDQGRFVHQGLAEAWLRILMSRDRTSARAFLDSILALYRSPKGWVAGLEDRFQAYAFQLDNAFAGPGPIQLLPPAGRPPGPTGAPHRNIRTRRGIIPSGRARPQN